MNYLYVVLGALPVVVVVAHSLLLGRRTRKGQWLCERDQRHFAGLWVAVDIATNEIISARPTAADLWNELRLSRTGRSCVLLSVPGEANGDLKNLLSVPPCVADDEYQCADGE